MAVLQEPDRLLSLQMVFQDGPLGWRSPAQPPAVCRQPPAAVAGLHSNALQCMIAAPEQCRIIVLKIRWCLVAWCTVARTGTAHGGGGAHADTRLLVDTLFVCLPPVPVFLGELNIPAILHHLPNPEATIPAYARCHNTSEQVGAVGLVKYRGTMSLWASISQDRQKHRHMCLKLRHG